MNRIYINRNKIIIIVFSALAALIGLSLHAGFLPVHNETTDIINTWRDFCGMISEGRIPEAMQEYVNFEDEKYGNCMFLDFENERIIFSGIDITDNIPKWKCRYWSTLFDHYWKRYGKYEKINFEAGYALLKGGKIVYVKIP